MKNITIIITSCILLLVSSLKAQEVTPTATLTPKTDSIQKKVKEFGIGFTGLNAYSLQYRWGNTKRLFRVNGTIGGSTAFGDGSSNSNNTNTIGNTSFNINNNKSKTPFNFSSSLSFSMLYLKSLAEKIGIVYGPVAGFSYSTITTNTTQTTNSSSQNNSNNTANTNNTQTQNMQPYLGFVFGAFWKISKSFFLYAEIAPNVYYQRSYTTSKNSTTTSNSNPNSSNTSSSSISHNNTFGLASLSNSGAMLTIVYRITK